MRWSTELLSANRLIGDPLADHVVNRLVEARGVAAAGQFFNLLISNLRLPLSDIEIDVSDFLEATSELPEWTDPDAIKQSEKYFVDHGPKCLLLLFFKSLPTLYLVGDGAKVLTRTGRLAHDESSLKVFSRRIAETGQFLLDVMSPGAFDKDPSGFSTAIDAIRKVRLIHASIRLFVGRNDWNSHKLGLPVNQTHLALTLMTFSVVITDGLAQLGIQSDRENDEAFFSRWKAIGHLLGIKSELLPENTDDGRELLNAVLDLETRETEEGKVLTEALVQFTKGAIPRERLDATPELLIQYLIGQENARKLGISTTSGCLGLALPIAISKMFNLFERLEDKDIAIQQIFDIASELIMQFFLEVFRQEKGVRVELPASLRAAWSM